MMLLGWTILNRILRNFITKEELTETVFLPFPLCVFVCLLTQQHTQ